MLYRSVSEVDVQPIDEQLYQWYMPRILNIQRRDCVTTQKCWCVPHNWTTYTFLYDEVTVSVSRCLRTWLVRSGKLTWNKYSRVHYRSLERTPGWLRSISKDHWWNPVVRWNV